MSEATIGLSRRKVISMTAVAASVPWTSAVYAAADRLYVIAELVAKSGREQMLRDLLVTFAKAAPGEPGCISYRLLEDQQEPGRFVTYEEWASENTLVAHLTSPVMKRATPQIADLLAQPFKLTRLKVLV